MRRAWLIAALFVLAAAPTALAQGPSAIVCIIEKHGGALEQVGAAKSIIAGDLAAAGWSIIDIPEFPVSVSGEDLNRYLDQQGGRRREYKSSDVTASISAQGEVKVQSKNVASLDQRSLRRLDWRIDLDRLQQLAKSAGASYILYGEVTTKTVPKKDTPEGFAVEGYASVIAFANLRLIDAGSRSTVTTFVDQAASLQLTVESAEMGAVQAVARKAGAYFVKQAPAAR
jgi:hypothetical protein